MNTNATAPKPDTTLAEHVRKIVDGWPPLTPAQVHRVAGLLRSGEAA